MKASIDPTRDALGFHPGPRDLRAADLFTRTEIRALTETSDLVGLTTVVGIWMVIAACFVAVVTFPHPIVVAVALVVLGGRQLALAIAMHEAAHGTLFRTKFLNDRLADLVCARLVFNDVARYRRHHLKHHAHTGTERDPDLGLAPVSPMTRASLARKVVRDLTGLTGVRRLVGIALMDAGVLAYDVGGGVPTRLPRRSVLAHAWTFVKNGGPTVAMNAALFAALWAAGHPLLYVLWIAAQLTTYSLFLRLRSLAEHACLERTSDRMRNTRSTKAGLLARMTVAPLCVNHHLEHHLLPTVPWFKLPTMSRHLGEVAMIPVGSRATSYRDVLSKVSSGRAAHRVSSASPTRS